MKFPHTPQVWVGGGDGGDLQRRGRQGAFFIGTTFPLQRERRPRPPPPPALQADPLAQRRRSLPHPSVIGFGDFNLKETSAVKLDLHPDVDGEHGVAVPGNDSDPTDLRGCRQTDPCAIDLQRTGPVSRRKDQSPVPRVHVLLTQLTSTWSCFRVTRVLKIST